MQHSALVTNISLGYPPISNYDFTFIKTEKVVQEYLKSSQLYMISQRPKLVFDSVFADEEENIHFSIRQESTNYKIDGVLPIRQSVFLDDVEDDIYFELGSYDRNYKFNGPPYDNLDGFKFYDKNEEFIAWLTPERLIYECAHNNLQVSGLDGWGELFKYKILYVGKATDQDIWKRLTGHKTLQEIMSKNFPLQYGTLPTHEIALLLFRIDATENFVIQGTFDEFISKSYKELNKESIEKLFREKELPSEKKIFLDAEKAFVNLLNPEYNCVKFKTYPKSEDGLFNESYDVFSYMIKDYIILISNGIEIVGSKNEFESDIIRIVNNERVYIMKSKKLKTGSKL